MTIGPLNDKPLGLTLTPRTDMLVKEEWDKYTIAQLARRLERELADMRESERREFAGRNGAIQRCVELEREVAELREQLRLANIDAANEASENAELREQLEKMSQFSGSAGRIARDALAKRESAQGHSEKL